MRMETGTHCLRCSYCELVTDPDDQNCVNFSCVFHLSLAERKFRRALMLIQFSPVGETRAVVPPAVVNFYYLPFYIKIGEKEKPTSQEFPLFFVLWIYLRARVWRKNYSAAWRVGQEIIRISRNINQAKSEARETTQEVLLPV